MSLQLQALTASQVQIPGQFGQHKMDGTEVARPHLDNKSATPTGKNIRNRETAIGLVTEEGHTDHASKNEDNPFEWVEDPNNISL